MGRQSGAHGSVVAKAMTDVVTRHPAEKIYDF